MNRPHRLPTWAIILITATVCIIAGALIPIIHGEPVPERISDPSAIPIWGATPEQEAAIRRGLATFTDDELAGLVLIVMTDADGRLRGWHNGWHIVSDDPNTCAEMWGDHGYLVFRDRPDCNRLLTLIAVHEACHWVRIKAAGDISHGPEWFICWLVHVACLGGGL